MLAWEIKLMEIKKEQLTAISVGVKSLNKNNLANEVQRDLIL